MKIVIFGTGEIGVANGDYQAEVINQALGVDAVAVKIAREVGA